MESELAAMKIAVTSRSFSRHTTLRAELVARYPEAEITFNDEGISLAGQALIDYLKGHDAAITALEKLDADVFDAVPELRVVSKYGVGVDMIDLEAMRARGVKLGWTAGVNRRSVSELVISAVIALLRHIPTAAQEVENGTWRQIAGKELSSMTVGIIGCGRVGKDLAVLLRAFGCSVIAHDVRDYPNFYRTYDIEAVDLDTLLARADIVTLHTPLDDTSRGMLSAERLDRLKPTALLINAARGGLVDEIAVKEMLKAGRLAGAFFDVFDSEPPDDTELIALPNVLVTPHIGGSSEEAIFAMGRAAIEGLMDHGDPFDVVNRPPPDGV